MDNDQQIKYRFLYANVLVYYESLQMHRLEQKKSVYAGVKILTITLGDHILMVRAVFK